MSNDIILTAIHRRVRMIFGPALKFIICSRSLVRRDSYWSGGISFLQNRNNGPDFDMMVYMSIQPFS